MDTPHARVVPWSSMHQFGKVLNKERRHVTRSPPLNTFPQNYTTRTTAPSLTPIGALGPRKRYAFHITFTLLLPTTRMKERSFGTRKYSLKSAPAPRVSTTERRVLQHTMFGPLHGSLLKNKKSFGGRKCPFH